MATEIVRWCDLCILSDQREPASAHALSVDARSGTIDLCDLHAKTLLVPLLDLISSTTPAPRGRPLIEGEAECLLCTSKLRPSRMGAHLSKTHGTTMTEVYGLTCPLCDYAASTGQKLSRHALSDHDNDGGMPGLWTELVAAGDPHGKVAERRALLGGDLRHIFEKGA